MLEALVWLVVVAALGVLVWRTRGRPVRRVGSAAVGSIYGMLNEDKRKAVEIVVEGRAGARDPEDAEGNLPDLEDPGRAASRARSAPSSGRANEPGHPATGKPR